MTLHGVIVAQARDPELSCSPLTLQKTCNNLNELLWMLTLLDLFLSGAQEFIFILNSFLGMEVMKDFTLGQKREHTDYTLDCHKDKELICKNYQKGCCAMV